MKNRGSDPQVHLHRGATPARRSGRHPDLHVLAQHGEEIHQTFHRKAIEAVANQVGHVRLADAQQLRRALLGEATFVKDAVTSMASWTLRLRSLASL